ncbi:MAG: AsmA family protein [Proteobacteria bacterium]|nr:AsmA family protein [Pseudomonadota bacterium]
MKGALKAIGIGALVLVIGAAAVVHFYLDHLVKAAAERIVPPMIQAPFTLGAVSLSPFSGKGTLKNIEIGSPKGFKAPHFAKIGRVSVNIELSSLLSDAIVVKSVEVESPDIIYETGFGGSNVAKIQHNVESATGAGTAAKGSKTAGKAPAQSKKLIIDHFVLKGARAHLVIPALASDTIVDVPEIKVEGIGRKTNGATAQEVLAQILKPLTQALAQAGAAGNLGKTVTQAAEGVGKTLKGLFGR